MKFTPLFDRIVVRRDAPEEKTGSIIVADVAKEKRTTGKVISVGQGRIMDGHRFPLSLKPGDHVHFGKYAGADIVIDGEEFLLMREEEVYGIIS